MLKLLYSTCSRCGCDVNGNKEEILRHNSAQTVNLIGLNMPETQQECLLWL